MCDCNESPFNKLRESWSRHYKKEMHGKCDCCCQDTKPKVNGKFGVAYIIETPTRKCKPCGWEVEFNDTPSQIQSNCEKMMNWITCPPLGVCNHTNLCCCSPSPKEMLNNMQKPCCKPAKQPLCGCCKEKCGTSGGDCCCKKPKKACCCQKEVNQSQCCPKANNDQRQCCSKPKQKPKCCSGQQEHLKTINKCNKCCCIVRTNEKPCCCLFHKVENECCCTKNTKPVKRCQSDSQSSIEDCNCHGGFKTKNKNGCGCNCSACKCFAHTKTQTRDKHTQHKKPDETAHKASTDKVDHHSKPSKNLLSLEPKKERQKAVQRSPYTISTSNVPKKDPDKQDFHEELTKHIMEIKKPEVLEEEPQIVSEIETSIKTLYQENEDDESAKQEVEEVIPYIHEPRKKIKRADLLKKIKAERRKEMQAIHSK